MHFWLSTARLYGRVPVPRKTSLNWFMPALVNSSVGSSSGTTLDDGTAVWPCFFAKKSRNCWRISLDVGMSSCLGSLTRSLDETERVRVLVPLAGVGLQAGDDRHDNAVEEDGGRQHGAEAAGDDGNRNA